MLRLTLAAMILLGVGLDARAIDLIVSPGDWTNGAHWSGGVVPGASDTATIGSGSLATGTVTYSAGTATTVNSVALANGWPTYNGTLIVTNGSTLNAGSLTLGYPHGKNSNAFLSIDGTSQFNLSSSLSVNGGVYEVAISSVPTGGRLKLGGTIVIAGGYDANGTLAELVVNSNSVSNTTMETVYVAGSGGGEHGGWSVTGKLTIVGATVRATSLNLARASSAGGDNTEAYLTLRNGAVFNVTNFLSGTFVNKGAQVSVDGASQLNLYGSFNLNGGVYDFKMGASPSAGKVWIAPALDLVLSGGYDGNGGSQSLKVNAGSATNVTVQDINLSYASGEHAPRNGTNTVIVDTVTLNARNALCGSANGGNRCGLVLTNQATLNLSGSLTLRNLGTESAWISGAGTVRVAGAFTQNGRAIADGGTLTLADYSSLAQTEAFGIAQPDGTLAGWYAVNGGKLSLKPLAVSGDVAWGETSADTSPDLVNSVCFSNWVSLVPGDLNGAFLASDHPLQPRGLVKPVGIWEFSATNGLTFSGVDVTFRYDEAAVLAQGVSETNMVLLCWRGIAWSDITKSRDTESNTISAAGVPFVSFFAIAQGVTRYGTVMVVR